MVIARIRALFWEEAMVITDFLERNSRLYGSDTALVVVSPSETRDQAVTWREASLIESATD